MTFLFIILCFVFIAYKNYYHNFRNIFCTIFVINFGDQINSDFPDINLVSISFRFLFVIYKFIFVLNFFYF